MPTLLRCCPDPVAGLTSVLASMMARKPSGGLGCTFPRFVLGEARWLICSRLTRSVRRRVSPSFHSCSTPLVSGPAHVALRETGPTNLLVGFPATGSQASTRPGPAVRFSAAASDAASIASTELLRRPEVACRLRPGARARRWSHRGARSTRSSANGGQERPWRSCAGRATFAPARRSPVTVEPRRRGSNS